MVFNDKQIFAETKRKTIRGNEENNYQEDYHQKKPYETVYMLLVDARHLEGSKWRRFGDERITVLLSRCRDDPDLCDNYSPALTSDKKCTDIPTKVYRNSDSSDYQDVLLFRQS